MGKLGYGYGSEWQLLFYLGRHRDELNHAIIEAILAYSGSYSDNDTYSVSTTYPSHISIYWLDYPWTGNSTRFQQTREWKNIEFTNKLSISNEWANFWPSKGNSQNWDAVGIIELNGAYEWLLIEAKAHTNELESRKWPTPKSLGYKKIDAAFTNTQSYLNIINQNWFGRDYQYANHLAALYFFNVVLPNQGISTWPARLVNIYFTREMMSNRHCPQDVSGWFNAINGMYNRLGLPPRRNSSLLQRVHEVYLPVWK